MNTKEYTYEDAVKANETHKRDVIDCGYVYQGEAANWDPQPFLIDYYGEAFRLADDVDMALAEFLRGDLCTMDSGEGISDYLERVHFEPSVADNERDAEILKDLDELEKIYCVTVVDKDGDDIAIWYLTDADTSGARCDTPEEAINAWLDSADISASEYASMSDHIYRSVHHSSRSEESYYSDFESMEEAREFADRFDLTLCLYNFDRGFSRGDGYHDYSYSGDLDPFWDTNNGIDIEKSLIGGTIYLEEGWSDKDFNEAMEPLVDNDDDDEEGHKTVDKIHEVFKNLEKGQVMLVGDADYYGEYQIYDSKFTLSFDWQGDNFEVVAC